MTRFPSAAISAAAVFTVGAITALCLVQGASAWSFGSVTIGTRDPCDVFLERHGSPDVLFALLNRTRWSGDKSDNFYVSKESLAPENEVRKCVYDDGTYANIDASGGDVDVNVDDDDDDTECPDTSHSVDGRLCQWRVVRVEPKHGTCVCHGATPCWDYFVERVDEVGLKWARDDKGRTVVHALLEAAHRVLDPSTMLRTLFARVPELATTPTPATGPLALSPLLAALQYGHGGSALTVLAERVQTPPLLADGTPDPVYLCRAACAGLIYPETAAARCASDDTDIVAHALSGRLCQRLYTDATVRLVRAYHGTRFSPDNRKTAGASASASASAGTDGSLVSTGTGADAGAGAGSGAGDAALHQRLLAAHWRLKGTSTSKESLLPTDAFCPVFAALLPALLAGGMPRPVALLALLEGSAAVCDPVPVLAASDLGLDRLCAEASATERDAVLASVLRHGHYEVARALGDACDDAPLRAHIIGQLHNMSVNVGETLVNLVPTRWLDDLDELSGLFTASVDGHNHFTLAYELGKRMENATRADALYYAAARAGTAFMLFSKVPIERAPLPPCAPDQATRLYAVERFSVVACAWEDSKLRGDPYRVSCSLPSTAVCRARRVRLLERAAEACADVDAGFVVAARHALLRMA